MILTKNEFVELCKPIFEKAVKCMETLLLDVVNINKDDIKDVVMTGGTSNIVFIQEMVETFFKRKPKCFDPITAIARGAAIVASDNENHNNLYLIDKVKYSYGTDAFNHNGPRSLFSKIIESRTLLPCTKENKYVTININQERVRIKIAEGEEKYFDDNSYINEFVLENLPLRRAGEVEIIVRLNVNESGILLVTAEEKTLGIRNSLEIKKEGSYYEKGEKDEIKRNFIYFTLNEK